MIKISIMTCCKIALVFCLCCLLSVYFYKSAQSAVQTEHTALEQLPDTPLDNVEMDGMHLGMPGREAFNRSTHAATDESGNITSLIMDGPRHPHDGLGYENRRISVDGRNYNPDYETLKKALGENYYHVNHDVVFGGTGHIAYIDKANDLMLRLWYHDGNSSYTTIILQPYNMEMFIDSADKQETYGPGFNAFLFPSYFWENLMTGRPAPKITYFVFPLAATLFLSPLLLLLIAPAGWRKRRLLLLLLPGGVILWNLLVGYLLLLAASGI